VVPKENQMVRKALFEDMKIKLSHSGKKRKHHKLRRRVFESLVAILMMAYLIFVVFNIMFPYEVLEKQNPPLIIQEENKVAIIDQLSLLSPNQTFVENVTSIFSSIGLGVDVFSGQEITVGFYKNLPMLEYDIIIFRVHSAPYHLEYAERAREHFNGTFTKPWASVYLFTSEPYNPMSHPMEQLSGRIVQATVTKVSPPYFAIGPDFIRKSMRGRFDNTLIIMSSCKILHESDLADAFIDKGAKGVISWNDLVDLEHTDRAIESLIRNLWLDKLTIKEAVRITDQEIGPDPQYESRLLYYPEKIGSESLDDLDIQFQQSH